MDLAWTPKVKHGGANKASIEIVCIPHAHVSEFLEGEWGDAKTPMEWNIRKKLTSQKDITNPSIKITKGHTWYNMMLLFYSFDIYF
jgi:hypothetical protein